MHENLSALGRLFWENDERIERALTEVYREVCRLHKFWASLNLSGTSRLWQNESTNFANLNEQKAVAKLIESSNQF